MYLTRYAGIFLMVVWLLSILLVSNPRTRIRNAAFYLVGLLPPVIIYSVQNYLLGETLHARSLFLQSIPGAKEKFVNALSVIERWFSVTSTAWPYHNLNVLISLVFHGFALHELVSLGDPNCSDVLAIMVRILRRGYFIST